MAERAVRNPAVVPRLLGPVDHGRLSVVLTLVAVGSVALTIGGSTLLARYVPAAPADRRPALARALTLRLPRNRIAPFAVLIVVTGVLVAVGRVPPVPAVWVLVALALNVGATLALQADLGLGRVAAWSARYPAQNAVLIAAAVALYAVAVAATYAVAQIFVVTLPVLTARHADVANAPGRRGTDQSFATSGLAGTTAAAVVGTVALPGCAGWRLVTASLAGAALVAGGAVFG